MATRRRLHPAPARWSTTTPADPRDTHGFGGADWGWGGGFCRRRSSSGSNAAAGSGHPRAAQKSSTESICFRPWVSPSYESRPEDGRQHSVLLRFGPDLVHGSLAPSSQRACEEFVGSWVQFRDLMGFTHFVSDVDVSTSIFTNWAYIRRVALEI